jgi:uncharacterized membrane protein YgaE (UPF0421/DUF939 family)
MNLQALPRAIQMSIRAGVGGGLSVASAQLFGLQYPIYAFLAAVIVTDLSPSRTRELGLRRLVATVVGTGIGAMLSQVFAPGPWALGLGVLIAMLGCSFVYLQDAAKVAGYICGIVLLAHGAQAWSYAFFRLIETVLGIGVATLISYVPKLLRIDGEEPQDPTKNKTSS